MPITLEFFSILLNTTLPEETNEFEPIFKLKEAITDPTPINEFFSIFVPAPISAPPPSKQLEFILQ